MNTREREDHVKKENMKIKKSGNRFLITFLVIFIVGYLAFFTSHTWMPTDYVGVTVTKCGEVIEANEREVTLVSWIYSKKQKKMEAIIEINNMSLDGIERYEWSCVDAKKGMLHTEVKEESDDFVVLNIEDVPRSWAEVSLRMDDKTSKEKDDGFSTIKLYAAKNSIEEVISINDKTIKEYRIYAIDKNIKLLRKEIHKIESENEEYSVLIGEAEKKKRMLEKDKKYQTVDECVKTDQKISELESEIEGFASGIDDNLIKITEIREKIELCEKKKEELGNKANGKG